MAARNRFSGFLRSASELYLSSGPDLGYSVSMPTAHPAHCTRPSSAQHLQARWDHRERSLTAAPCPSLAAPWHPQTRLLHSCNALFYHQSLKSQTACVLLFKQHTEQIISTALHNPTTCEYRTVPGRWGSQHRGHSHVLPGGVSLPSCTHVPWTKHPLALGWLLESTSCSLFPSE